MRRARRCKGDHALLEGPHLVTEALAAGIDVHTVVATERFLASEAGRELAARLERPPSVVAETLLDQLTDSDAPRGIAALGRLPRRAVEALPVVAGGIYLFADGIQDPGNLGALARVVEAGAGAGMCLGPGTAHPNHPRALRASAGSLLRLPLATAGHEALRRHLEPIGARWLGLLAHGGADLYRAPLAGALVLAVGAEGPGLSPAVAATVDGALTIPLAPPVESLNATVSAAVVLFELRRRQASR